MNTDEIKNLAADAVGHWFNLDVDDMEHGLTVGLTLEGWRPSKEGEDFDVFINFSALPGHNFESWAHRHWKWNGKFRVHVSWLPPGDSTVRTLYPHDHYENDYEIEKKANQRPYVLDCKHGQIWMRASE
jgi:hypothetical protein